MHFIDNIRNPQGWSLILFQSSVEPGFGIASFVLLAENLRENRTVARVKDILYLIEQDNDFFCR